jgi:predicted transposase YbfD/YdcC
MQWVAKKIREKEADYILAVKENHPYLYEEITRWY